MSTSVDNSNMGGVDSSKLTQGLIITAGLLVLVAALLCIQILRYRLFDIQRHTVGRATISLENMNKTTLSNSTLKLLPIQTYVEMGEEVVDRRDYDTCAICLEQFVVDVSQVRKVPCGHIFHVACVESLKKYQSLNLRFIRLKDPWLKGRSSSCPICKADCHINAKQSHEDVDNPSATNNSTLRNNIQLHNTRLRSELLPFTEQSTVTL
ncbi:unnamed protein product [Umbelopsis vinacea]